jgi:hypothetical protein
LAGGGGSALQSEVLFLIQVDLRPLHDVYDYTSSQGTPMLAKSEQFLWAEITDPIVDELLGKEVHASMVAPDA